MDVITKPDSPSKASAADFYASLVGAPAEGVGPWALPQPELAVAHAVEALPESASASASRHGPAATQDHDGSQRLGGLEAAAQGVRIQLAAGTQPGRAIPRSNLGHVLLRKAGWKEGTGLGPAEEVRSPSFFIYARRQLE